MNIFKSFLGGKEDGQDNIPHMKLGSDAGNAWYDEKSKKWRFKGEELKEEDNNRSVLPPKKFNNNSITNQLNYTSEQNNLQNSIPNISNNTIPNNNNLNHDHSQINNNFSTSISQPVQKPKQITCDLNKKNNLSKNDPNTSVYFSCNEEKILDEIRRNNTEILRNEKMRLEEEFKRNRNNYERIIKNYEGKLKEMESSEQEFIALFVKEKEKLQVEIKNKVIENVNNKFKIETLSENLSVIAKENEVCKKLVKDYRNLIENHDKQTEDEKEITQIYTIQENFQEMFKQELDEKSKLVRDLMDSFLSIAKAESKNKKLLRKLNNLQVSYKNLLDSSSFQEKKYCEIIESLNINFTKERENINSFNEKKIKELIEDNNKKLNQKEIEIKEKITSIELDEKNREKEKSYNMIKELEDELNFNKSQQRLLIEEKNKKIEELSQQTLKLQFEIEETSHTLEQYQNFEKAYKDNINRLNDKIFYHEKNKKDYELNMKNLKITLKELFKMNNIGEIDNKILNKLNEINLLKSHEEFVYITKSFINEFIKYRDEQIYYLKEKKGLETDIINLKVEKEIYTELVEQKDLEIKQIQEISNSFKERAISLEEENSDLRLKCKESDKELISKLEEEIISLTESVREKDSTITSINNSIKYLNEKIITLEKSNKNYERNCENLSRYEKYSEMLETEKADLQKIIFGLKFELDKKKSFLNERETLLSNVLLEAVKISSIDIGNTGNYDNDDKEILLSNAIKKISEILFSFKLEKNHLEKENKFYIEEIERLKNSKSLLLNEINFINDNKSLLERELQNSKELLIENNHKIKLYLEEISKLKEEKENYKEEIKNVNENKNYIESELNSLRQVLNEKNNDNTVPLEEYDALQEKLQRLMELIQSNNEAYDNNIQKIVEKNKKKIEKYTLEIKTKIEENELLANNLESSNTNFNDQINLLQKQINDQASQIEILYSTDLTAKQNFLQIFSDFFDSLDTNHVEYLKSVDINEITLDTCINCVQVILEKLNNKNKEFQKINEENTFLNEEISNLNKNIETFKQEQLILMENLKEKETEKITLQETLGNLEMSNQTITSNYHVLNKTYETLLRESKSAEKIIEYKKKVENLVEEKLTLQNSNKLIIESLTNEIKELNTKINELTQKQSASVPSNSAQLESQQNEKSSNEIILDEFPKSSIISKADNIQKLEINKKPSSGFLTNFVKAVFLTETEKGKI